MAGSTHLCALTARHKAGPLPYWASFGPRCNPPFPQSAAARLFAEALRVELGGTYQVLLPSITGLDEPTFIAEGGPIPVAHGVSANAALGPAKKLAVLAALTNELSARNGEAVVRTAMCEAAARALDAAVFSTAATSALRPAGILYGVTRSPRRPAALPLWRATSSCSRLPSPRPAAAPISGFSQAWRRRSPCSFWRARISPCDGSERQPGAGRALPHRAGPGRGARLREDGGQRCAG
jgi:hypothetical protein